MSLRRTFLFAVLACCLALAPCLASAREVSVVNCETRISASASLPLNGAHDRSMPRLHQWQTTAEAKAKDRWERKSCAR
jgi:hypothetical protein